MIKISDVSSLNPLSEIDSYGLFSIGCLDFFIEEDKLFGFSYLGFRCKCTIGDDTFTVFLYKIGITSKYIVLSDFSCIPDVAVINNEEILESLKPIISQYIEDTDLQDYDYTDNIKYQGTTSINYKTVSGIPYCTVSYDSNTLSTLSSSTSKFN